MHPMKLRLIPENLSNCNLSICEIGFSTYILLGGWDKIFVFYRRKPVILHDRLLTKGCFKGFGTDSICSTGNLGDNLCELRKLFYAAL